LKEAGDFTPMKRSKTSKAWMQEHVTDPYVQRAKAQGWRSRAAFKLMEIDTRDRLLRPGMVVVDLGAAPGSWSQVVVAKVGPKGRVFALDLLEMAPIPGVDFLQGDFHDEAVVAAFEEKLAGRPVDLVLSDIAPNMSGIGSADQVRGIHLCELALDFAAHHLAPGGRFLVKVFQGTGFDEFRAAMQATFHAVAVRKPEASRDRSAEVYLVGTRLKSAG
jgi:23S rRNA (uridine2552-2'-O)-methyltransferase